jgi:hypothetical protein
MHACRQAMGYTDVLDTMAQMCHRRAHLLRFVSILLLIVGLIVLFHYLHQVTCTAWPEADYSLDGALELLPEQQGKSSHTVTHAEVLLSQLQELLNKVTLLEKSHQVAFHRLEQSPI